MGQEGQLPLGPLDQGAGSHLTPRCGTSARRPQLPQLDDGACDAPEARPAWGCWTVVVLD